jgi:hypothetical protein
MTSKQRPKGGKIYSLAGRIIGFGAPNIAPGGPGGPVYIEFGMTAQTGGQTYNGVFYIEIAADRSGEDASNMARAFVSGELATVEFQMAGGWHPEQDPGGVVLSVTL